MEEKRVGGWTMEEWLDYWGRLPYGDNRTRLRFLLTAAFDSTAHERGRQQGIEEAANLALGGIRQGLDSIDIEEAIRSLAHETAGGEALNLPEPPA